MSKKKSRPINRQTEDQANKNQHDRTKPTALRQNQEIVFRDELAVLLDEYKGHLSIMPAQPREDQNPKYFIGVVAQDEEFILTEMCKRLASKGLHPTRWQIKDYLNAVSDVMRSKLAWGEEISALPFLNKNYYQAKKRGRKCLPKKGKKRGYKYNGNQYPSIRQAALDNPDKTSYNTLKSQAYRELKREQPTHIEFTAESIIGLIQKAVDEGRI